ncbi:hypothetical protein LCM23_13310 [Cytobacillus kochii]|uniref:hypothetical protein n=1 Tax=Cytobacillus kochii TaxID=859143 RepID=UPI001CD56938|nr:hypothetical protein [Cytobacillus kochii]MCA1027074.1 hypothetical protein [Cytobacillus kochii]
MEKVYVIEISSEYDGLDKPYSNMQGAYTTYRAASEWLINEGFNVYCDEQFCYPNNYNELYFDNCDDEEYSTATIHEVNMFVDYTREVK